MIAPTDLLAPVGPVEKTLFPGESSGDSPTLLETRLQTYIDQAYEKIEDLDFEDPDEPARVWSLHLTFEAAYTLAVSRPSNENSMVPVLGSQGFSKDQRDALKAKSLQYASQYTALAAMLPTEELPRGFQSRQVTNSFD